ncbi:MAG: thymidine phosphorylase [Paracoccaceae bacterium]|jgi:thymidine phosphorylase|nr:thymidine phosphorylase [Paracoccaceae bacterium]MDP7187097.1 thymidine phosphorylase [Paracoccaceae bacterium]
MDARAIICKVRDREIPTSEELRWFANGLAVGGVSDAQAGAFAMAVLLNGLQRDGRVWLTEAMRDSGQVLTWDLNGPVVDKHSTGGLGDCLSLVLAPALAACGAYVPMISGRGLGHTGGTLDKLEAIAGYQTAQSEEDFRRIVGQHGCAIVSASGDMAPADKRLYGVRDISGTVESIDLITASILSKKLAAGLEHLVLDVKCGTGAFMHSASDAHDLAAALVETANQAGCKTSALITDMDQPLAHALGNALEVREVLEVLCNGRQGRLLELTIELGAVVLAASGLAATEDQAAQHLRKVISSGAAAEKFAQFCAAQGAGDALSIKALPKAPIMRPVAAPVAGHIRSIAGVRVGLAVVSMGGGRQVETDLIDPSVGLSDFCALRQKVERGEPLCIIHAADEADAEMAEAEILASVEIGDDLVDGQPLVLERVG